MAPQHLLLLRSAQSTARYGLFLQEILRSEGFMQFDAIDLDTQCFPRLGPDDLIVLSRCILRRGEIDTLCDAVQGGAALVAVQPQAALVEKFGGRPALRVIYPGMLSVEAGLPSEGHPLQTHVPITCYANDGSHWSALAHASPCDGRETPYPALVRTTLGRGTAWIFFYDLAEAIARLRFGDPALANYATTGLWAWPHAADQFQGQLDIQLSRRPHADLHSQILAHALIDAYRHPLARFWYYPAVEQRAGAVIQSDEDSSTAEQVETLASVLERRGGATTLYLMHDTALGADAVNALRRRGHTFGPHPNPHRGTDEWHFSFPEILREETAHFRSRFGPPSPTLQSHCAPWLGHLEWVSLHVELGYRLLFAYISLPVEMWGKFMAGSGRPIRFFDGTMGLFDCWQQPIIFYDDTSVIGLLTNRLDQAHRHFESVLADALECTHTTLPFLSHPVSFCTYSRPFMERCFDRLVSAAVPILNGDQWLEFIDRRATASLKQESSPDGTLRCRIRNLKCRLALMLPTAKCPPARFDVRINGTTTTPVKLNRFNTDYLAVNLAGDEQHSEFTVEFRTT